MRVEKPESVAKRLTDIKRDLTGLSESYIEAIALARLLEAALAAPSPDQGKITGISGKLHEINERITSSAHPLIKYDHML